MTPARSAAVALAMLALGWLGWVVAGWLIERFGLPAAPLLQQAVLFALFLSLADRLAARVLPSEPEGEPHG
jgi:hypothetical protein